MEILDAVISSITKKGPIVTLNPRVPNSASGLGFFGWLRVWVLGFRAEVWASLEEQHDLKFGYSPVGFRVNSCKYIERLL